MSEVAPSIMAQSWPWGSQIAAKKAPSLCEGGFCRVGVTPVWHNDFCTAFKELLLNTKHKLSFVVNNVKTITCQF